MTSQHQDDPLKARPDFNKLIALREVTFLEVCDRPRNTRDAHASTDKTFQRYPANSGKALFLFITPDLKTVLAQDPDSLEYEEFPLTTVRQYQRLTERHVELAKNPNKPGSVHRLAGEPPRPPQVPPRAPPP